MPHCGHLSTDTTLFHCAADYTTGSESNGESLMPDIAATGVYSVEGQDALANQLAFGSDQAPEDDASSTDGGGVADQGDSRQQEPEEYRISPLDESRAGFQAAENAQPAEQAEAEAAQRAHEQAFQDGLLTIFLAVWTNQLLD
jgi:hypothetical protein